MDLNSFKKLQRPADSKILMIVIDGLGGLPIEKNGDTELETAQTPHLDALAFRGICGLHQPVGTGITPGSGPGHLALFGYDPVQYQIGRGVLSATGINFDLKPNDIAARGNFCTVDDQGRVTDRRAGRISTETCRGLCDKLRQIDLPGAELFIEPVKDYRFLLVIRGEGLGADLNDTDPQVTGRPPAEPRPGSESAQKTAELVTAFIEKAKDLLADEHPANMALLRGFSQKPDWPMIGDIYGIRAAAIAGYPMYRGVSKLIGMDVIEAADDLDAAIDTLQEAWNDYDFFYFHVKKTDSAGEDGDFQRKTSLIELFDEKIPWFLDLNPDVLIVTGDHSTPAAMKSHSWHPVPVLLWSPQCRQDRVERFGERACMNGSLGPRFPAADLMPLAMAHAGRLEKFGA